MKNKIYYVVLGLFFLNLSFGQTSKNNNEKEKIEDSFENLISSFKNIFNFSEQEKKELKNESKNLLKFFEEDLKSALKETEMQNFFEKFKTLEPKKDSIAEFNQKYKLM